MARRLEEIVQELYERMIKDSLKKYVYARDFIDRARLQVKELESKKESRQVAKYGLSLPGGLVWLMTIRLLILMQRFLCSKRILSLTSL